MSLLLSSVLKFTVGILIKKLRDEAARRLIGDPTDETFRQFISRELNEIKSKLDALLKKDLLSSIEFLEDGISHLQMSISCESDVPIGKECYSFKSNFEDRCSLAGIGLATTTGICVISSEERFERAQECFKIAGQQATKAFSNPALEIEDRILATKLRITSRILEGLKDLESAVNAVIMYLASLHELPAIQEAFSVYFDGKIKSIFNKTERLEILQNISMMNLVLFSFTKRFTSLTRDLFSWPTIQLEERTYQPVLRDKGISLAEFDEREEAPFQFQFNEGIEICNIRSAALDSKGNIIAETKEGTLSVINTITGTTKILHSFYNQDTARLEYRIDSLAVDNDDNVYVVTCSKGSDQKSYNHKMWVMDLSGKLKHSWDLDFLHTRHIVGITVQIKVSNKMALLKKAEDEHVYICDNHGKLKFSFTFTERFGQVFLSNSDEDEIFVGHGRTVCVYTHKGNLLKTIKLPEGQMCGLAFNQITKNIIALTKTSVCMHLLSFDITNDILQTLSLGLDIWSCNLNSHPRGLVALIDKNGGLFI